MKGPTTSVANLPTLNKQNNGTGGSVNDTKDTINVQEVSRRGSQGAFSVKRPKLGEADFDYSTMNTNLRYIRII